jgi:hypothetical protein
MVILVFRPVVNRSILVAVTVLLGSVFGRFVGRLRIGCLAIFPRFNFRTSLSATFLFILGSFALRHFRLHRQQKIIATFCMQFGQSVGV